MWLLSGLFMYLFFFFSSPEISHFEVVVKEVSESGYGPAIALATCSPLLPSSPVPILNDYIFFHPTGESKSNLRN
jgi:hypothetical protein